MTVEQNQTDWILRLDGDCNMATAGELKALLLEGLASKKKLQVDLERAGEIDITLLQLLWAVAQAAPPETPGFVTGVSEPIAVFAHHAGFESFPGEVVTG